MTGRNSTVRWAGSLAGVAFAFLLSGKCNALAEQAGNDRHKTKPQQEIVGAEAQKHCSHIANVARQARNELQQKQLNELEQRIRQRLTELEARKSELQAMLDRHDALLRKADQALIDVYSRIHPEAAAAQMANLDEEQAASLLMQLRPKYASAILNEMDAAHAATVVKKLSALSSLVRTQNKP